MRILRWPVSLFVFCTLLNACASLQRGRSVKRFKRPPAETKLSSEPPSTWVSFFEDSPHLKWPVVHVRISQRFQSKENPRHEGIDIGGTQGTEILASHSGRVAYVGRNFWGYGNMVIIEFNRNWSSLYAHLQTIVVRRGQLIAGGEKIGTMGRSGNASGTHLHFELRKDQHPVNPVHFLPSIPEKEPILHAKDEAY